MMGRALLILGWLATLGFVATAFLGYGIADDFELMTSHILLALLASLLVLFSHSWIMFYLIGTGRAIKEAVQENHLEADLIEETKKFKSASYPWLMLAVGLVIATFVVGAGVYTNVLPRWVHHTLFYLTAVVQGWTLVLEGRVLVANERLMNDIDRRIAA